MVYRDSIAADKYYY